MLDGVEINKGIKNTVESVKVIQKCGAEKQEQHGCRQSEDHQ